MSNRRLQQLRKAWAAIQRLGIGVVQRGVQPGRCPICGPTVFVMEGQWLRDDYRCLRCYSIPRWRAVIHAIETEFPRWRDLTIHESSPGGAASRKMRGECPGYSASHFWPNIPLGSQHNGFQCEDLQALTLKDNSVDLVVTQDVFEHLPFPQSAFSEIARVIRPGGAHIFTVPWWPDRKTLIRAEVVDDQLQHLMTPDFHKNPINDGDGALVFREWGDDLLAEVERTTGLKTEVKSYLDRRMGLEGEFLQVFITRKPRLPNQ